MCDVDDVKRILDDTGAQAGEVLPLVLRFLRRAYTYKGPEGLALVRILEDLEDTIRVASVEKMEEGLDENYDEEAYLTNAAEPDSDA